MKMAICNPVRRCFIDAPTPEALIRDDVRSLITQSRRKDSKRERPSDCSDMHSAIRLTCYLPAAVLLLVGCGTLPTTERGLNIGRVKNLTVAEGCGCAFGQSGSGDRNARYVWVEDVNGNAWINIDASDVKLSTNDPPPIFASGPWETRRFRGAGFDVEATYRLLQSCPPNDEACEVATVKLDAIVKRGSDGATRLRGRGICGC